jgi:hypothetical protein
VVEIEDEKCLNTVSRIVKNVVKVTFCLYRILVAKEPPYITRRGCAVNQVVVST